MSQSENVDQIIAGVKRAIDELRSVDSFLERLDSLDPNDLAGSEYLVDRLFTDERNYLFNVLEVLENEILPELEKRA